MRGQEPGSEHERAETDGSVAPATTPPPSFGQLLSPADDQTAPPVLYGDAVQDGGEGDQQETAERLPWPSAGGAPIPVYPGPPPNLPAPEPPLPPSWPEAPRSTTPDPRHDPTRPTTGPPPSSGPQPPPADALGYPPPPGPAPDFGAADTNPANPVPGAPHADAQPWNVASQAQAQAPEPVPTADVQPWNVAAPAPAPEPVPTADLPELPAFPGAKPWEVPGEEAEYDWFADPEPDDPQLTRTSWPKPELPSGTPPPGEPTWEPPPGFTAAAAGMQVWPSPVTDPAVPPWPAATGEPIPGADYDALETQAPWPGTPAVPANPQHPATAPQSNTPQPPGSPPQSPGPQSTRPNQPPGHQSAGHNQPPGPQSTGPNQPPGHQGTGHNQPPGPQSAGPNQPFDPGLTLPVARQAEPGDIPVWPMKQSDDTGPHQLPELPFPPEVWGPKPELPAPRQPMALPPADSDTPPHGIPAFPGPRPPAADSPHPDPARPQAPVPNNFQPPARQAFGNQPFAGQQAHTQPGSLFTPGGPTAPPQPGPPQPPAKGKKVLLAALGVLVLAGVATGAFFAYRSINGSKPADAAASQPPATSQPSTSATTDPPDDTAGASVLNSEQTDPKKLALTEAFPAKKIKIGGRSFTRVKTSMAENCEKVAAGPFADALRKQDCSRVLRATYVDSKRRYAVTTGLAVLPTKEAAVEADQAKNLSRNLWFRALPGSAGSGGDRIHIAGGYAAGLVWGRYIVFSYATYADGHTPTEKETGLGKISGGFRDQTAKVLERRIAAS
ncbi:hypothetical protein ACIBKY_01140 [Nonomuraea sp. NPDC050394]|uniref:hypothetical protein n=1 Tax=Nonomuraea sp. NPDC050394 TaxID=3364363 RepID=UPI0037A456E7